jgi:hypothetical protein
MIKSRSMRWVGYVKRTDMRYTYKIFVGNPAGKNQHGRIGCEIVDWIHLAQDSDRWWAVENTVMSLRVL